MAIVNKKGEAVERFDNLNLNELVKTLLQKELEISPRLQFNIEKIYCKWYLQNLVMFVSNAPDHKAGLADTRSLPFGVMGPRKGGDCLPGLPQY